MDPITHGIAGYVVVKSGLDRDTGRWGTWAGVLGSLFPDIDGLLGLFLSTEFTVRYHRYLTNSLFLVIPYSLLFAWLWVRLSKIKRFGSFFTIWVIEILVHNFLDLITSYGTMILSPLSRYRFSLDWVFIIDPYLLAILIMAMILIWIWKVKALPVARLGVCVGLLYIGLCAVNHSWAMSLVERHVKENALSAMDTAALPQPLSPFFWANYVLIDHEIHEGFVNLIGRSQPSSNPEGFFSRFMARYSPIQNLRYQIWKRSDESEWAEKAMKVEGVSTFFEFARFPVIRTLSLPEGAHRVIFFDLRFNDVDGHRPFVYSVTLDPSGKVMDWGFLKGRGLTPPDR